MNCAILSDGRHGGADGLREYLPAIDPETLRVHIVTDKAVRTVAPGADYFH